MSRAEWYALWREARERAKDGRFFDGGALERGGVFARGGSGAWRVGRAYTTAAHLLWVAGEMRREAVPVCAVFGLRARRSTLCEAWHYLAAARRFRTDPTEWRGFYYSGKGPEEMIAQYREMLAA